MAATGAATQSSSSGRSKNKASSGKAISATSSRGSAHSVAHDGDGRGRGRRSLIGDGDSRKGIVSDVGVDLFGSAFADVSDASTMLNGCKRSSDDDQARNDRGSVHGEENYGESDGGKGENDAYSSTLERSSSSILPQLLRPSQPRELGPSIRTSQTHQVSNTFAHETTPTNVISACAILKDPRRRRNPQPIVFTSLLSNSR